MRHEGIPYAFQDLMWQKYNFKEVFRIKNLGPAFAAADKDSATKTRNPFLKYEAG
jgi:hypothetical protein